MIRAPARSALWALALFVFSVTLAPARRVEIRVLHTTDLHGHVLSTADYEGHQDVGGLLRCATLIKKLRAERDNVVLLDCGDLYQGSAESLLTDGRIMTRALDALKYDAWILGNHEFDWGLPKLLARHDEINVSILAGNIGVETGRTSPLAKLQPFLVKEFDGVRVVIVGLITPGVPTWSLPDLLGDLQFQGSVDALRNLMPAVRAANPDILLLATHQGYKPYGDDQANEINAIAQNFPEFDAIIGGHSHRVEESVDADGVLFTQAGYYGIWLGCLDLDYDTVTRELVGKTARVLPVMDLYEPDAELEKMFHDDLQKAQSYLDEKIGTATDALPAELDDLGRSPVQMMICRAIAESCDAEIVLHGILADEPLAAGDIRMSDVWRVAPYENRIGILLLTPEEIEELLAENLTRKGTIQYMGAHGLSYELVKDAEGQKSIGALRLADGSFLHPRKRYRVAVNSYVLASGGGRFPKLRAISLRPEVRMEVTDVDTRTALIKYIKKHSPLSADALLGAVAK